MALSTYQDAFAVLQHPSAPPHEKLAALTQLKNDAVGHLEKKQDLLRAGIAGALQHILEKHVKTTTSQHHTNGAGHDDPSRTSDESEICFQAVTLTASLAAGGATFIAPLTSINLIPLLFSIVSDTRQPQRIISVALKALLALASAGGQSSLGGTTTSSSLVWASYDAVKAYTFVLSQDNSLQIVKHNVALTCSLIEHTTITEPARVALEKHGILSLLASHLTSYYVYHHPRSGSIYSSMFASLPAPLSSSGLESVLGATAAIVAGPTSRFRVASLLFSPKIFCTLPFYQSQTKLDSKLHQPAQQSAYDISSVDLALPWIHSRVDKMHDNFARQFPALGSAGLPGSDLLDFTDHAFDVLWTQTNGWDSAFVSWLIHVMRVAKPIGRINAARLVLAVSKGGFLSPSKDRSLALLVVPLLLDTLKNNPVQRGALHHNPFRDPASVASCQAPRILADLLEEVPSLQRAAVDGNVIKELCTYLKQTFASFESQPDYWSANSTSSEMDQDRPASSTLGSKGTPSQVVWLLRCRENALHLLAALASKEDSYRKKLCDNGMVPCIVDSLNPLKEQRPSTCHAQARKQRLDAGYGNPEPVLLAACKAATALSRSVGLLRTSLTDSGLAKPIFALVKQSRVDVTVAATGVVCNLIMDFSPVRSELVDLGAIKTLCEHAHSADSRIRLLSLWALKHLVNQAPNEVKTMCLEELGPSWLDQIISGSSINPSAASSGVPRHRSGNLNMRAMPPFGITGANSRGERVNILQAVEDQLMQDTSSEPSPVDSNFNTPGSAEPSDATATPAEQQAAASKSLLEKNARYIHAVKHEEDAYLAAQPARDELQIQRHALDFIRNITTGPAANEMIEYLQSSLGFSRLYDMIAGKLRPMATPVQSAIDNSSTYTSASSHTHSQYQPASILASTVFIVSHIAAGQPKYRQLLISQVHILSLLKPLYTHPDQEVRCACVWVALNLMWIDDVSDTENARARGAELKRLGFDREIEGRLQDQCLDIAERARTAWDLMEGTARDSVRTAAGVGSSLGGSAGVARSAR